MTPLLRKWLFETLYKNRYLYRFASTVPFAGQWRVWQRLVLPRLYGHDVLELGCGLGDLLADMLADGYDCRAVELSPQMVAAARATLRRRNVGQCSCIIQGSAQCLPFCDDTFDTVVSTFPSEYIYDPVTLAEIVRVLRPGGRLIIVEAAQLLPVGFLQPVLVSLHRLVYGPRTLLRSHKRCKSNEQSTPSSKILLHTRDNADSTLMLAELPASRSAGLIPLEHFGLQSQSQCIRTQRWEAYMTTGVKATKEELKVLFPEQ